MSQLDRINYSFKSARMKINAFLRRQRWKEALIFFSFVLLAFGFWLLQSLQQEYEIEISIPVRYKIFLRTFPLLKHLHKRLLQE